MKRSNLLIAFYMVLIFGSGAVVGIFATRLYDTGSVIAGPRVTAPPARQTPQQFRQTYVKEMQDRLNLAPDQLTKINEILDQTGAKVHEERERHNQAMKSIHEGQVAQTRGILTDAQRPDYDKLRKEREERSRKMRAQPGGGPPPR